MIFIVALVDKKFIIDIDLYIIIKLHLLTLVYNWFNDVKHDRSNLSDDLRGRRPSTATTEENANAVQPMRKADKRVTYQ